MTPDALREVALEVAQTRTADEAVDAVVQGLAESGGVALARIWLVGDGDSCNGCAHASVCKVRERCLHLRASKGLSVVEPTEKWRSIEGDFSRIPLNSYRKVGQVASTGSAVLIEDVHNDPKWGGLCEWETAEEIVSFAGQPLMCMGETLGAVGVFSRSRLSERELRWLRAFADRVALSIVNARAFDKIEELKCQLERERDYLREEVKQAHAFGTIIGQSPALHDLLEKIEMVAPTDTSVLLHGESGTGKELAASAIHEQSARSDRTLVRVNCASVPRELFESEFFGHVRGSFSGAVRDRQGRFDLANHGTLFLDEVGEIPLDLQSKLLRVLQEGTFERVGDERTRTVDVRVIAATNRDLKAQVAAGNFREDLYYRLNVFPVSLPALRDRTGDVPQLAQHFLDLATKRMKRDAMTLTVAQVEALQAYDWPGNIRELQNIIERGVIMSKGGRVRLDGLILPTPTAASHTDRSSFMTEVQMQQNERANLVAVLQHADGKLSGDGGAAGLLGIKASTLASRIKKFEIGRPEYAR